MRAPGRTSTSVALAIGTMQRELRDQTQSYGPVSAKIQRCPSLRWSEDEPGKGKTPASQPHHSHKPLRVTQRRPIGRSNQIFPVGKHLPAGKPDLFSPDPLSQTCDFLPARPGGSKPVWSFQTLRPASYPRKQPSAFRRH
jgi:hypothetical protein